ncbi:putative transcriptional regulator [Paenibacillus cellulosilyticus]|uniref:Putative transcriptional regulator n=1 Tax=Paenibacillus cellulosilyticus TaxID=375489 RepID=A0A2V2YAD7_9BACL|nr:ArsR family transcriptional regulator [Paenibacillus cellulosilyticus]PWV88430.1 putative transcriptional regulator [Paenibacillus cellulosilyticus]QKS47265.1 ArsR family transcriptional regulator [Paenibacillus cellulosilyticus]
MQLTTNTDSLRVYEALASEVRLAIIDKLFERERHVKELAAELYLSNAVVSGHIRKLEEAGVVGSKMKRVDGGTYKYCYVKTEFMQIKLSPDAPASLSVRELSIPIGHYTDYEAIPTCGIATTKAMVGQYDQPVCFMDPERVNAGILWFARGWVEYKIPNYLYKDQRLHEIEISLEIGSEAPRVNEHWPSDIRFYFNNKLLGVWTSPGDFGKTRGRLTPEWWQSDVNQYGLLKVLRIKESGTYVDGLKVSDVGLLDIDTSAINWTFRIAAEDTGRGRGGLTLYGRSFGNYDQDLIFRSYYT